jgi:hypothetical protein
MPLRLLEAGASSRSDDVLPKEEYCLLVEKEQFFLT